MRFALCLLVSLSIIDSLYAAPIAPSNPLELSTEVGSVAGVRGKITVRAKATISKKQAVAIIDIESRSEFDFSNFTIAADDLKAVISTLTTTLQKPDEDFSKDVGGLKVTNKESEGKRVIRIQQKEERFSLRNDFVEVDPDNAATLLSLLNKSVGLTEWMLSKAGALQK